KLILYTISQMPKNKSWLRPILEARKTLLSEAPLGEKARINDVIERVLELNPLDTERLSTELKKLKRPKMKKVEEFEEHVAKGLKLLATTDDEGRQLVEDFSFLSSLAIAVPFEGPMASELLARGEEFLSSVADQIGMIMLSSLSNAEKVKILKTKIKERIAEYSEWLRRAHLQHGLWVHKDIQIEDELLEKWTHVLGFSPTEMIPPHERAHLVRTLAMRDRIESILSEIIFIAKLLSTNSDYDESEIERIKEYVSEIKNLIKSLVPDSIKEHDTGHIQLLGFLGDAFGEIKEMLYDIKKSDGKDRDTVNERLKKISIVLMEYRDRLSMISPFMLKNQILSILGDFKYIRKKLFQNNA
ncbi:MAG: hypothetical protein QXL15_04180, partial [Candidatus Korarchaeota archaeon]